MKLNSFLPNSSELRVDRCLMLPMVSTSPCKVFAVSRAFIPNYFFLNSSELNATESSVVIVYLSLFLCLGVSRVQFSSNMDNNSSFINLLNSQNSFDLHSPDPDLFSTQGVDDSSVSQRKKWTPAQDKILIGAWLNTSKDAIVSNEQKAGAFWQRITQYYNSSPLLVGTTPRELVQCKQRGEGSTM